VSGDSKQIETRILAYIVGDMQALEDFSNGLDPYVTMAASIFGIPYEVLNSDLASDDPEVRAAAKIKRQIGKSARLGCGFQLGPAGFVNYCKVISKVDISEAESNDIVARFRATNPLAVQFWATCKDVLMKMEMGHKGYFGGPKNNLFYYDGVDSVGGVRVPSIRMPDGMKLYYNNLEWVPSTKFEGMTMVYTSFKRAAAIKYGIYGGKLTENLVQALAFAVMKYQGVLLKDNGFTIAANTHDEYTAVVPEADVAKWVSRMKTIMDTAPVWLPGCPLGSEVGYAKSYADC
jgi:DNA polymerase